MLITNANIITWETPNRVLSNYAVLIEGDKIKEVGTTKSLTAKHPKAKTVDAKGQYLMPGGICAHTHFYGDLLAAWRYPVRLRKIFQIS